MSLIADLEVVILIPIMRGSSYFRRGGGGGGGPSILDYVLFVFVFVDFLKAIRSI